MKIKVIVSFCALCIVLSASALFADEIWQGNAAVSLRGELDRDGYYAASNSFPPGTKILVTNLDNGKRVIVTVRQRLDGSSNVFVLLSSNAGNELGMKSTDVIRIKSQIVGISTDLTDGINLAQNRDMETNPSVGAPDLGKTSPSPSPLAENSPPPSPSPSPASSPSPSPSPLMTPAPTPTPTPAVVETNQGRGPEKDRFSSPSGQEGELSARTRLTPVENEAAGNVEPQGSPRAAQGSRRGRDFEPSRPGSRRRERGGRRHSHRAQERSKSEYVGKINRPRAPAPPGPGDHRGRPQ